MQATRRRFLHGVLTATAAAALPPLSVRAQVDPPATRSIPSTGEAISLFRIQDVIDYLAEANPEKVLNLPPRPHQLMRTPEGA